MSAATITLLFLLFAVVMFVFEKIPLGVTSMIVCIGLVVTGVLDVKTAFAGFIPEGMIRFRLLCGDFLLPNPAPYLENRMTVCMGYPAMTPQGRAGKRRRKGAGNPCRENGTPNANLIRYGCPGEVQQLRATVPAPGWSAHCAGVADKMVPVMAGRALGV